MTARIMSTRPCERRYYQSPESAWFDHSQNPHEMWTQPATTEVQDMVTVDISHADLKRLLTLEHHHETAMRDPRVRDAWEKYQLALALTQPFGDRS